MPKGSLSTDIPGKLRGISARTSKRAIEALPSGNIASGLGPEYESPAGSW